MISPTERSWNSATTLYIARKLDELSAGRTLKVLDLGCGAGVVMEQLFDYKHELYGYDLDYRKEPLVRTLGPRFGDMFEDRIRIAPDERTIPFESGMFDAIYANQVFEHVKFIDRLYSECARVLKPGGALITLFPLATYPLELHVRIPFAHWLPPGRLRVAYLQMFYMLRLRPLRPEMSAHDMAVHWDEVLKSICYYRFMNEIQALSETYFEHWELDTRGYIRAKIDLLNAEPGSFRRKLGEFTEACNGPTLDFLITHLFGAVFVLKNPRLNPHLPRTPESLKLHAS